MDSSSASIDRERVRQAVIDNALDVIADCNSIISEMEEVLREVSKGKEVAYDDSGLGDICIGPKGD